MWSACISTGSARNLVMVSVLPVMGLTAVSWLVARSKVRTVAEVRSGWPVRYTVGAESEWTASGVVIPCWVASRQAARALTSPILTQVHGPVTPSHPAWVGGSTAAV